MQALDVQTKSLNVLYFSQESLYAYLEQVLWYCEVDWEGVLDL